MNTLYDLVIIGGGPAGSAAGVYAGRKKMKTVLITESFGGQSVVSESIENWIGTKKISGLELAKMFEDHVRAYNDVEIKMPERVTAVREIEGGFETTTNKGAYHSKTLIVVSGGRRRHLNVPGEDKFNGRGVSYCSTCDAPLFRDKEVAVVGGGNAGLEAVVDLLPYASKIYLLNIAPELIGDPLTREKIKNPKVRIINNAETQEILGSQFVEGLRYLDKTNGKVKDLSLQGVFIEIGSVPNSDFVKGLVELNKAGEIIIDHRTATTSKPGIFAAGDVTDEIYKQNNTSAGDAVAATLSAYNYLLNIKKQSPAQESISKKLTLKT